MGKPQRKRSPLQKKVSHMPKSQATQQHHRRRLLTERHKAYGANRQNLPILQMLTNWIEYGHSPTKIKDIERCLHDLTDLQEVSVSHEEFLAYAALQNWLISLRTELEKEL